MKRLKRLTGQMLAVLLAGTLTVGSLSVSAFGAEGDMSSTSEVATSEIATEEVVEDVPEDVTEYAEEEAVETDSADTEYSAEGSTEEASAVDEDTANTTTDAVDTEAADTVNAADTVGIADTADDPASSFTVTLDANGGYFVNEWDDVLGEFVDKTEILNKVIPVGEAVSIVPVRDPEDTSTFLGWSLERYGTLLLDNVPLENCTLYAVWQIEDADAWKKMEGDTSSDDSFTVESEMQTHTLDNSDEDAFVDECEANSPLANNEEGEDKLGIKSISADEKRYITGGDLNESVSWTLDTEGYLEINGSGDAEGANELFKEYEDSIYSVSVSEGITSIGRRLFKELSNLEYVFLPDSVQVIEEEAFANCFSLKNIKMPEKMDYIGNAAFDHCTSLQEIMIPNGIDIISLWCFCGCSSLESVVLPNGINEIQYSAFNGCSSLNRIVIPSSVTYIGYFAFFDVNGKSIYYMGTREDLEAVIDTGGIGVDLTEINYHEHVWSGSIISKEVDCTSDGYTLYTCEECGAEIKKDIVKAKGHCLAYHQALEPTFERDGNIAYWSCDNCQKLFLDISAKNEISMNDAILHKRIKVESVLIEKPSISMEFGDIVELIALVMPDDAENKNIKWTSSDIRIATVNDAGQIRATGTGVAIITVTTEDGNKTSNCKVAVNPASIDNATVYGLITKTYTGKVQTQSPTVKIGSTTLKLNTDYTVSYKNNTNAGTATVTIKGIGNYTGTKTATFKINKANQSITAKTTASSIAVGKTATVSITGNKGKKSYKSSNTAIATVNASTGKVTAKKVGTVKITATSAATANYNAASKTVTLKIVPAATSKITAANQAKGIKVGWKKVTGANGYIIYRNNKKVKTIISGSTVAWTDTAANTNGTKYVYKVVPTASTGNGTAKSLTTYRVARPAVKTLKNSTSKKMTVTWGKNAKATGYQIQYSTSKTFAGGNKTVTVTKAATVSKSIGSLTKGKTYYVRIRTYKTVGSTKYWSAWSAAKSVKISK